MRRMMVGTNCTRSAEEPADTNFLPMLHFPILRFPVFRLLVACVLALMFSPTVRGQATGSFSGNVLDKSGGAIPGATVTATSQATSLARDVKTDSSGHYLIPLLPVGLYSLRVDAAGFQSAESKDLLLHGDEARELDFPLAPATVVTSVAVTGNAVAVETASPSLGQVINSQQVS